MNLCNLKRTFAQKTARNWDTLYVLIDVHGVIIPGSWHKTNEFRFISEDCIEVLQWFSKRSDFRIILWTSSYLAEVNKIGEWLLNQGIEVDYINCNPECKNTEYADFTYKPYFNILIDDKSGMEPEIDWLLIGKTLEDVTGDSIIKWDDTKQNRLCEGIEQIKQSLNELVVFPKIVSGP